MLQFEDLILESYSALNKKPRDNQLEVINSILESLYVRNKKNVILNAPTGSGKSIIAAVLALCCEQLKDESTPYTSWILSHRNMLTNQYMDTIVSENSSFLGMKGANNFNCKVLSNELKQDVTAEACIYSKIKEDAILSSPCSICLYKQQKAAMWGAQHIITNYSLFLVHMMFLRKDILEYSLHEREVGIFDESHIINDAFCGHCAINISKNRLASMLEDIQHTSISRQVIEDALNLHDKFESINKGNYFEFLEDLHNVYIRVKSFFEKKADSLKNIDVFDQYVTASKLASKYTNFKSKISDFLNFKYEHVFDKNENKEIIIQPIFINRMKDEILFNNKNVFMSATNSPLLIKTTLELDDDETEFIDVSPFFPPANKSLYFMNSAKMNYNTLKDESDLQKMILHITTILQFQEKKNTKGIIITPSFKYTEIIAHEIKKLFPGKIIDHIQGTKAEHLLDKFKSKKGFHVLISPSIYEGVDFAGKDSEWQVIVKAPFPSLAEERMKFIADKYPDIYKIITILKIVQGLGRSIRSKEDKADSFLLDTNLKWLFDSPFNTWKHHFLVKK